MKVNLQKSYNSLMCCIRCEINGIPAISCHLLTFLFNLMEFDIVQA
jgi:hypothetical protein